MVYDWFDEDTLIVGFEKGYIALISVRQDNFGQEKFNLNLGPNGPIECFTISNEQ